MLEKNDCLAYVAIFGLACVPSRLLADSFRCGNDLIHEGMPAVEIREKCGAPDAVETASQPIMARRPNGSLLQVGVTTVEYWSYDRGPRRFPARLTIEEGVAKEIELLGRN